MDISNTPGLLSVQRWNGSLLYFIILYYYTLYIDKILTIVVKCFSPLLLKIILETKKIQRDVALQSLESFLIYATLAAML